MFANKESEIKYPIQKLEEIYRILIDKSSDPIFSVNSIAGQN